MKKIVILGAGTAGTMMANHLARKINHREWSITIVDEHRSHYYQPGFLLLPFGFYSEKDVVRNKADFIPGRVEFLMEKVELIDSRNNRIQLLNGKKLDYHILIVATGAKIVPDEIEGLEDSWHRDIFDFYTIEGAKKLREKLANWEGGKMVVHLAEMPIKCPVAPLEFTFLSDWFLKKKGLRDQVDLTYVTPLSGAFTKQICSDVLGHLLVEKNINLVTDFSIERVDSQRKQMVSYDEKKVDYDLLVTVPTNMGDPLIERSGMGDDLNFIPTDKHTLQSKQHENIFVLGDAADVPTSKAGSVAHFQAEVLTGNIMNFMKGKAFQHSSDGHANCFIESGDGKAFLIDFNYDIEPVQGRFPFPILGPFSLLKETRINHLGKLAFRWMYWNLLLRGRPMPGITTHMTKAGKKLSSLNKEYTHA
ncbi:MAG: NAD(P)/FAD-dependent oxidoreductase [Candidatus Aminicenantes bacterium]|nr:NAD(P)/FAD-dependent oxidoreductase [Candidatus Aminicenantes bacterium]